MTKTNINNQIQNQKQKYAIITGCNRGIGQGILNSLLTENYFVFALNRTKSKITNKNYQEIICDVSNSKEIKQAVKQILKQTTKINLLVPNAAIRRFNNIGSFKEEDWNQSIDTNLNSVFHLTNQLIKSIIEAKGSIIIVGSHSEKYPFATGSAYCSTKAALKSFCDCLLEEVRDQGVKVTYLSIGAVKNRDHGYDETWKLTPQDIGNFIVSLTKMNPRALASYIDLRPAKPLRETKQGIEKLQYL
jgi:NADP-dependent 3-hydroxy acid dehydrogenase YdfG